MKIKVLTRKETITKNGKEMEICRYFTPVNIEVIDSDGNSLGIQQKNLSVHFKKDASRKLENDVVFAIFTGTDEQIRLPFQYHIPKDVTNEEEHKKNYVWIRGWELMEKVPYKSKKNTCTPIIDEEDTKETLIEE